MVRMIIRVTATTLTLDNAREGEEKKGRHTFPADYSSLHRLCWMAKARVLGGGSGNHLWSLWQMGEQRKRSGGDIVRAALGRGPLLVSC